MTSDDQTAPVNTAQPLPDLRVRDVVLDYEGMHALVGGLSLPVAASMSVMSALETSRELLRHSFYRYEFATVAVVHSLIALEQVLTERLAVNEPLQELIGRASATGLVTAELAAELDRCRLLRDRLVQGTATSAVLQPLRAIGMVRAVFDAASLLSRSPSAADEVPVGPGGAQPEDRLAGLWEEHRRAPYPESFRGVDIDGVELILLDADTAGLLGRELKGGLDSDGVALLWACIAALDRVLPLINEEYCSSYFTNLRTAAGVAAAHHLPAAI
ncbi:hypothetical protein ACFW1A_30000 [Kitasatospora sp. NPDC058965]|uniref:hypothetical protein n=1 Tax=Kitasatospora sp. NPDC058965 TaxID=3346682 RepID=UPI00369513C7